MSVDRWRIAPQLLFWRCRSLCRDVVVGLFGTLQGCSVQPADQFGADQCPLDGKCRLDCGVWSMQFDASDTVFW